MTALYEVQVRTDKGNVREINEDAVGTVLDWRVTLHLDDNVLAERGHLFAVADGMGGHAAGEVASRLGIETVFRAYYGERRRPPAEALTAAIATANEVICRQAAAASDRTGMGTTLVAALWRNGELLVANVGDSRAYLFREGSLERLTRDHSWVAEQVAAGLLSPTEAERHPYRNVITHSLGPDRNPKPDLVRLQTQPGDRLLLCSDGLSNLVGDEEMAALLAAYPLDQAADRLLGRALERGAPDNISLILVHFWHRQRYTNRRRLVVLLMTALMVLALAVGQELFGRRSALPSPTPSVLVTMAQTPSSALLASSPLIMPPLAEPVLVGAVRLGPEATADAGERFGAGADSGAITVGRPLPDRYVVFVRGIVDEVRASGEGLTIALTRRQQDGRHHRYVLTLREPWPSEVEPVRVGAVLAVVGRPVDESDREGDIALEALAVLAEDSPQGLLRTLWRSETNWPQDYAAQWVFTTYGEGGAAVLGVATPVGLDGLPIALWGGWMAPTADSPQVLFRPLDRTPYEWADGVYRQPDH